MPKIHVCVCRCHRQAGDPHDGIVRIILPPAAARRVGINGVYTDDPIEAVSACSNCSRLHCAPFVPMADV